ncbi:mechanosensitive ion channel family protein [Chloroflexota bacterium]
MKIKRNLISVLVVISVFLLMAACTGTDSAETPVTQPTTTSGAVTITAEPPDLESDQPGGDLSLLEGEIATRTPIPTVAPGVFEEEVSRIVTEIGVDEQIFLGLGIDDWIILGVSLLVVLAGYIVGTWLIRRALPRAVARTSTELDDRLLEAAGPELRWLVVLFALRLATIRLTFIGALLKTALVDFYFILTLFFFLRIIWHLVELANQLFSQKVIESGREDELAPLVKLVVLMGQIIIILVGGTFLLSHFGVDVAPFATIIGFSGLALSLAAKDIIADFIAGLIILVSHPFRVGDRIEIKQVGTWGDVTDIGLRTTSIRTLDNRMVIVPNSTISANEVINYTFPDPRYRIQTHVGIGYGTPITTVHSLITETVYQVDGVLEDKPVDVLYHEMGDSAMIFRVRWWIDSYVDTRRVIDRVHTVLQDALDAAKIDMPFPTQNTNFQIDPQTAAQLRQAWGKGDWADRFPDDDEAPSSFQDE